MKSNPEERVEVQIRAMVFSPGTAPVLFRSAYTETTVNDLDNLRKVINLSAVGDGGRFSFETEAGAEITIPKALLLTTVFIVDVRPLGTAVKDKLDVEGALRGLSIPQDGRGPSDKSCGDVVSVYELDRGEPTPLESTRDHGEPRVASVRSTAAL